MNIQKTFFDTLQVFSQMNAAMKPDPGICRTATTDSQEEEEEGEDLQVDSD